MSTNTPKSKEFKKFTEEEKKEWLAKKIKEDESIDQKSIEDLRDFFVTGIKEILESNDTPRWRKSWITILNPDSSAFPEKFTDRHLYGYSNGLRLLNATQKQGYVDNRWLSLSDARKLKLEFIGDKIADKVHILRPIIKRGFRDQSQIEVPLDKNEFAKEFKKRNDIATKTGAPAVKKEDIPTTKKVYINAPVQRYTNHVVYNLSLFKGYEASNFMGFARNEAIFKNEEAEKILNYCGATIRFGYNAAYFQSSSCGSIDRINMPLPEQFDGIEHFFATLFHELIHHTGHSSRLNRKSSSFFQTLNKSEALAFEELIAEIGSALMCLRIGITQAPIRDSHLKYVANWLQKLDNDVDYVSEALKFATSAVYHIQRTVENNMKEGIKTPLRYGDETLESDCEMQPELDISSSSNTKANSVVTLQ